MGKIRNLNNNFYINLMDKTSAFKKFYSFSFNTTLSLIKRLVNVSKTIRIIKIASLKKDLN